MSNFSKIINVCRSNRFLVLFNATLFLFSLCVKILSDWTLFSSAHNDPMASDVIAPSPWTIFGCKNGNDIDFFVSINEISAKIQFTCFRFTFVYWGKRWWLSWEGISYSQQCIVHAYGCIVKFTIVCLFPQYWDDHPAIMAVGVVDANSEAVFQTLMSLGQSRSE